MIIRRLTERDWNQVDRIRISAPSYLGVSSAMQTSGLRFLSQDFKPFLDLESNRYIGIGVFDDQSKLISFMTSIIDRSTAAWYVQLIMSSRQERVTKFNGIEACTDWMIQYAEARGISKFWYSIPLKYEKVHRTAWRKVTKHLSRYDRQDICVIPKYTRCSDSIIRKFLMSELVLSVDMLIRCNTLRPEEPLIQRLDGHDQISNS